MLEGLKVLTTTAPPICPMAGTREMATVSGSSVQEPVQPSEGYGYRTPAQARRLKFRMSELA